LPPHPLTNAPPPYVRVCVSVCLLMRPRCAARRSQSGADCGGDKAGERRRVPGRAGERKEMPCNLSLITYHLSFVTCHICHLSLVEPWLSCCCYPPPLPPPPLLSPTHPYICIGSPPSGFGQAKGEGRGGESSEICVGRQFCANHFRLSGVASSTYVRPPMRLPVRPTSPFPALHLHTHIS
jgi:hypothetical protein